MRCQYVSGRLTHTRLGVRTASGSRAGGTLNQRKDLNMFQVLKRAFVTNIARVYGRGGLKETLLVLSERLTLWAKLRRALRVSGSSAPPKIVVDPGGRELACPIGAP